MYMYMYIYIYIHLYVCIYIYQYTCWCAYTYIKTHANILTHLHTYSHTHTHTHLNAHPHATHTHYTHTHNTHTQSHHNSYCIRQSMDQIEWREMPNDSRRKSLNGPTYLVPGTHTTKLGRGESEDRDFSKKKREWTLGKLPRTAKKPVTVGGALHPVVPVDQRSRYRVATASRGQCHPSQYSFSSPSPFFSFFSLLSSFLLA